MLASRTAATRGAAVVADAATAAQLSRALPIALVAEGNAETWESWSGISHSVLLHLRSLGYSVSAVDAEASRVDDVLSKCSSFHPKRAHWIARHHFGPVGFALRSRRATRGLRGHPSEAPVLQVGATFLPALDARTPFYVYCDANARFSMRGGAYGPVHGLSATELRAVCAREERVYRRANGIFTMSECVRRSFIEDFGIPADRVVALFGGPNLRTIPERVIDRPTASPPTILFIGRQFERKGGPTLVAAFRQVREHIPAARLLIAGCEPDLGAEPGVTVLGSLRREGSGPGTLAGAYAQADLFCMPSRYEPFGVVFVEAMLHGIPCVGADAWAMPEIIAHGETGWVVPPEDIPALAETLTAALRRRDVLAAVGAAARARALDRFTWSRVAETMVRVMAHDTRNR